MRAAVYRGPGRLTVEDVPMPDPGADDVVVKVHACGVCGSDLHGYRAGLWVEPGEIMGHEWAGELVARGANVQHLRVGDRVAVGGGGGGLGGGGGGKSVGYGLPGAFAEYVRIPGAHVPGRVARIPDELSYDEAAALEPLRCGLHAAALADPQVNDWAVVLGAGMIGLSCMQALKLRGSCRTIVVDVSDRRLELARELGADVTLNGARDDVVARVKEITGEGHYRWGAQARGRWSPGARADVVVEAAGTARTLMQALELVRHGGTVAQIALFEEEVAFDPTIVTQKQIRLQGCAGFGLAPFEQAADLVRSGRVRLAPLITHRFPLERIGEALRLTRSGNAGRVVLTP